MNTHSLPDDPTPYLEPLMGSYIVCWQWYLVVPRAVCTRYLILRSVVEWSLHTASDISKQRLSRVEWLLMMRSKHMFASS